MGPKSSKLMVTVPSRVTCFPQFQNEDELQAKCNKASSSISQARSLINLASEMLLSPSQYTKVAILMSVTTGLFTTILDRLCKTEKDLPGEILSPSSCPKTKLDKKESQKDVPKRSKSIKTLEEALIRAKIDKAVANSAVADLHAKIVAIGNRYDRLLSPISEDDKLLEVVPALTLCEEVLELFRDRSHVFWKNPLISAPFLVPFAGIYTSVGELSQLLLPSYRTPLNKQILLLQNILVEYKTSSFKTRSDSIKIRPIMSENMIESAIGCGNDSTFYFEDSSLNSLNAKGSKGDPQSQNDTTTGNIHPFDDCKEALRSYNKTLEDKYESFFEDTIQSVRSFSGFTNSNTNSPASQSLY